MVRALSGFLKERTISTKYLFRRISQELQFEDIQDIDRHKNLYSKVQFDKMFL